MQRLYTVKDIQERYQVAENTARRFMHQMVHMEKPLRVTESAITEWELARLKPGSGKVMAATRKRGAATPQPDAWRIPRRRE